MRMFVGGSLRNVPRDPERCNQFVAALGREIVRRGHTLLNGCRSQLDARVAEAAANWLRRNRIDPQDRIMGYCLPDSDPVHSYGTVRRSELPDWAMSHPELRVPEQIGLSQVTMFVAGSEGTFWAKNWALWAGKPILGVPRFGGAGEKVYEQELKRRRSLAPLMAAEYERLNQLTGRLPQYVRDIVDLAERTVLPPTVFTIMPFDDDYRPAFGSFESVLSEFGFVAYRTDNEDFFERIVPRIEGGIRESAFVVADVSELSPNVFYELGFAKGQAKPVVLTARQGTSLPFDVADLPVIWWQDENDLAARLRPVVADVVRDLAGAH